MNKMQKLMALGIIALMTCGAQAAVSISAVELTEETEIDLTALGSNDWVIYQVDDVEDDDIVAAPYEQKLNGVGIVEVTGDLRDGFGSDAGFATYSWTDGTNAPTGSEVKGGWATPNSDDGGSGFQIELEPTDGSVGVLTVVAGAWNTTGTFTAELSTGETDSVEITKGGSWAPDYYSVFTIEFQADAGHVLWFSGTDSGGGNVFLSSAAVSGGVVPEPTTMMLLGLGGLGAIIRRRRR